MHKFLVLSYVEIIDHTTFVELEEFYEYIKSNSKIQKLFESRVVNNKIWDDILLSAGMSEKTCWLIRQIRSMGHAKLIDNVVSRTRKKFNSHVEVSLESAVTLSDEAKQDICGVLKTIINPDISIEYTVNPSIIGGVIVKWGSFLCDGSVRGRIRSLEKAVKTCH